MQLPFPGQELQQFVNGKLKATGYVSDVLADFPAGEGLTFPLIVTQWEGYPPDVVFNDLAWEINVRLGVLVPIASLQ